MKYKNIYRVILTFVGKSIFIIYSLYRLLFILLLCITFLFGIC
ncbi:hypothetical protein FORC065_2326 [Yersinia enterocolitica]|nr:hypothetical protein FORC065_2326 [Yersinia enterocolitica]